MPRYSWTDEQMLEALHMHEVMGKTMQLVAERFGRTRNSVAGLLHRINKETNASDPNHIQNGTMKPKWWAR